MAKTITVSTIFIGIILIGFGVLVLERPELIKYWVAAAFFLSGISYFIRTFRD